MTIDEKLDQILLLQNARITKTRFESIIIDGGQVAGMAIGQGKCKAVVLSANLSDTYNRDVTQIYPVFYYGDATQQTKELYATSSNTSLLNNSDIIFCQDLNEIFVRNVSPPNDAGESPSIEIQITIYD